MKGKILILSDSALGTTGFSTISSNIAKRAHESGWEVVYLLFKILDHVAVNPFIEKAKCWIWRKK